VHQKQLDIEQRRLAEIQFLTEQVLYDLHKDYYRAIGNGLIEKARKVKAEIQLIEEKCGCKELKTKE